MTAQADVDTSGVLNPQYPSSWWGLGFSDEVRSGEVVPIKLLERDLILWRDSGGVLHCQDAICPHLGANIGFGGSVVADTVRCPFHGYQYAKDGALVSRVGERASTSAARLCLPTYPVQESFGSIYIWNGPNPPDHDVPGVEELFPEAAGTTEADYDAYHLAFYMPFPAKWFAENAADANHFGALHGACDWGETDSVVETPYRVRSRLRLINTVKVPSVRYFRNLARIGQLTKPAVVGEGLNITTYGGGLHVIVVDSFAEDGAPTGGGKMLDFVAASRAVVSWTPVSESGHWNGYTFVMPKLALPIPARLQRTLVEYVAGMRTWGPMIQDYAVMSHRQEPESPAYGQLDRGLITFRRFWDSRILDQSVLVGDNARSNGARAGIKQRSNARLTAVNSDIEMAK